MLDLADLRIFLAVVNEGGILKRRASSTACRRASRRASKPRGLRRHRAVPPPQAAPAPFPRRRAAARLCREAAAPLRRGVERDRRFRARRRAAPRRAGEHDGEPPARSACRVPRGVSGGEDRAHDRHQRRADGGGARSPARCRIRRRTRGGAGTLAPSALRRAARPHHPARPPRGARPRRRRRPLGDRVPERLRVPAPALPLARRNQHGDDARPRPRLIPRDRRLRRLGHRHRPDARVGARYAAARGRSNGIACRASTPMWSRR